MALLYILVSSGTKSYYYYLCKIVFKIFLVSAYPKLVLVLKGLLVPINDAHRQSINLAARHIYEKLSPSDLIPCLITKGVIHHIDAETIRTIADSKGRGSAAVELMFILPNRSPNWYRLFIEALIEHDDSAVLPYLIDPDLAKRMFPCILFAKRENLSYGICDLCIPDGQVASEQINSVQ